MPTQMRLREVLHYDPETGIFTWTKGDGRGTGAGTVHDDRGYLKVSVDNRRYPLHPLACFSSAGHSQLRPVAAGCMQCSKCLEAQ